MEKFAFIIHPLEAADVARKFHIARRLPDRLIEGVLHLMPPFVASQIEGPNTLRHQTQGWFVACPLTSRQMLSLPYPTVMARITAAGRLAQGLGAKIIGLGAFTSVVGDGGISAAKHLKIPVTTGNSYTVATALTAIRQAAALMGTNLKTAEIAIIGAGGSIGAVCAELLAREASKLTLVGRDNDKLDRLARRLLYETGLSANVTTQIKPALAKAEVVLTVTSAVDILVEPEDLRPGAIVCDVSRPRNVSQRVAELRDDVLVIEGGIVQVPGDINFNLDFGLPPGTCYGCMAETMVLAMERRYECFSLGKELTVQKVAEIEALAGKHGFKVAGLRSFDRALSLEEIGCIKQNAMGHNKPRLTMNRFQ